MCPEEIYSSFIDLVQMSEVNQSVNEKKNKMSKILTGIQEDGCQILCCLFHANAC